MNYKFTILALFLIISLASSMRASHNYANWLCNNIEDTILEISPAEMDEHIHRFILMGALPVLQKHVQAQVILYENYLDKGWNNKQFQYGAGLTALSLSCIGSMYHIYLNHIYPRTNEINALTKRLESLGMEIKKYWHSTYYGNYTHSTHTKKLIGYPWQGYRPPYQAEGRKLFFQIHDLEQSRSYFMGIQIVAGITALFSGLVAVECFNQKNSELNRLYHAQYSLFLKKINAELF